MGGSFVPSLSARRLALTLLALAAALFALVALTHASPASARSSCSNAKASPKAISTRQAKHAVFCLLNHRRATHGLSRLRVNHALDHAARRHSLFMQKSGCFDHECPGEPTVLARLRQVNYIVSGLVRWMYGENIAWGGGRLGTPAAMVDAWMHSPEHRANILNPDFRDLGVGIAWATPGKPHADGGIYTTDFGLRRG